MKQALTVITLRGRDLRLASKLQGPSDLAMRKPVSLLADHLRDAEFQVEVISNQGAGAAAMRIEATRRIFPRCWFNELTTEAGRDALGYYTSNATSG